MKASDIIKLRLQNQLIASQPFDSVAEVVRWLGAVQAQDYLGSLWAIGCRMKKSSDEIVEKAIEDRLIVRSWPMRGTLHFTAAEDLRWMQSLLALRALKKGASFFRLSGVDEKFLKKATAIIEKALQKEISIAREDLYEILERSKIDTGKSRGLLVLQWMAHHSIICQATRKEKQYCFALTDNWIPKTKAIDTEEALGKLALTYFRSHGPATIPDFTWWSGLNLSEAKKAIEIAGQSLTKIQLEGQSYWLVQNDFPKKKSVPKVYLLPSYDEYTVGYKDRSLFLDKKFTLVSKNGIFAPVILIDGKVAGTWQRAISKKGVALETKQFYKFSPKEIALVNRSVQQYKKFVS